MFILNYFSKNMAVPFYMVALHHVFVRITTWLMGFSKRSKIPVQRLVRAQVA